MSAAPRILRLPDLPPGLEALRAESAAEGFRFIGRLAREWQERTNRFDGPGEALLGACESGVLLAVCGLNRDPYAADAGTRRLRHLYVRPAARRRGIASALVGRLLELAEGRFHTLRLRTETEAAAAFYARHGFRAVTAADATHARAL